MLEGSLESPSTSTTQSADEMDDDMIADSDIDAMMLGPSEKQQGGGEMFQICRSASGTCILLALRGYDYCHKHILEDAQSPFQQCTFVTKPPAVERCANPAPKNDERPALCIIHTKELEKRKEKTLRKRKQRLRHKQQDVQKPKKRPSTLAVKEQTLSNKKHKYSSSETEEFTFISNSSDKLENVQCTWFGNHTSDVESTDSEGEGEGVLSTTDAWTEEECVRILKQKIQRLRQLYTQEFRHIQYKLKSDRRDMLLAYDMDPASLADVPPRPVTGIAEEDYAYNMYLQNYECDTGVEVLYKKLMKEKRSKGVNVFQPKKNDLPRCQSASAGVRCANRVLPFSKYCHLHILGDADQYLYAPCSHAACPAPVQVCLNKSTCDHHDSLPPVDNSSWSHLQVAIKSREGKRKRRIGEFVTQQKPRRISVRSISKRGEGVDEVSSSRSTPAPSPCKEAPMDVDKLKDMGIGEPMSADKPKDVMGIETGENATMRTCAVIDDQSKMIPRESTIEKSKEMGVGDSMNLRKSSVEEKGVIDMETLIALGESATGKETSIGERLENTTAVGDILSPKRSDDCHRSIDEEGKILPIDRSNMSANSLDDNQEIVKDSYSSLEENPIIVDVSHVPSDDHTNDGDVVVIDQTIENSCKDIEHKIEDNCNDTTVVTLDSVAADVKESIANICKDVETNFTEMDVTVAYPVEESNDFIDVESVTSVLPVEKGTDLYKSDNSVIDCKIESSGVQYVAIDCKENVTSEHKEDIASSYDESIASDYNEAIARDYINAIASDYTENIASDINDTDVLNDCQLCLVDVLKQVEYPAMSLN